jgi:nucleolar complex protein 2
MAQGKPSKQTKKFLKKQPTNKTEAPKIQKSKHKKSSKPKVGHAARTVVSKGTVQGEVAEKKSTRGDKRTLLDGMSMDEFLNTAEEGLAVDEMERMHVEGLGGLKEKDPSFYEFLKANDRELLEFDPDTLEMEDEDEEEQGGEVVEGGLTTEVLDRWEKLLSEEKSLGTLKKVLIAVKHAAANVTGDETHTGNAKYILTDPSGTNSSSGLVKRNLN